MRGLVQFCFLIAGFSIAGLPQTHDFAPPPAPEPKTSMGWFLRASERMNLRMPGASPFHMKVTFHAFPGEEFLPQGKSEILTGDGIYEETWLAPRKWRREVTLAGYHAVEADSDKGRKMLASSGYEPSRVLMLLNALLEPIPRNFASIECRHEGASGWSVDHLQKGSFSTVRISKGGGFGADFTDAYYFSPRGLLELRNQRGLATGWTEQVAFAGRVVPRHLSVAARERRLLDADVSIEEAGQSDASAFDLPVGRAEAGETLRTLQKFEVKFDVDSSNVHAPLSPFENNYAFSIWGVFDNNGKCRELEFIYGVGVDDGHSVRELMEALRKAHWRPPEIDGSRCEYTRPLGGCGRDPRAYGKITRELEGRDAVLRRRPLAISCDRSVSLTLVPPARLFALARHPQQSLESNFSPSTDQIDSSRTKLHSAQLRQHSRAYNRGVCSSDSKELKYVSESYLT